MKPILVFQQAPTEKLGTLESRFRDAGLSWQYLELFRAVPERLDLQEAAGLVVLGGPMNVDDVQKHPFLQSEVRWIQEALEAQLPLLGICLGAQLLAKSLGAKVSPNHVKEIGWYEIGLTPEAAHDPLFAGCGPRQTVFQWHGDTFDLPAGAVHLARSEFCPHQAFRYGPSAWGLQFHIEMTVQLIHDWMDDPHNRRELAALTYIDPTAIRLHTPELLPHMESLGQVILPRFAALCREVAGE